MHEYEKISRSRGRGGGDVPSGIRRRNTVGCSHTTAMTRAASSAPLETSAAAGPSVGSSSAGRATGDRRPCPWDTSDGDPDLHLYRSVPVIRGGGPAQRTDSEKGGVAFSDPQN